MSATSATSPTPVASPSATAAPAQTPQPETLATSRSIWGTIYRLGAPPPIKRTDRSIFANQPERNADQQYADNTVTTSRYTWYNFVPVFLFQQFSRFANFYFLIVCVLQAIPEISITSGVPSSAIPLAFVLFFDAIVTAREDYVRHRDDARANARKVLAMRGGSFVGIEWRDVCVGDILKVQQGEEFPADLVFLSAENEDPEARAVCHVQTAQLDGETNLKMRNANERTVPLFQSDEDCASFKGRIVCEEPHENFAKFNGAIYLDEGAPKGVGLDASSTLLRGCVLKNVPSIYGMVVYTGRETKVRVRQTSVGSKKASVEAEINTYIVALIAIQLLLCIAGAVGYSVWGNKYAAVAWYLRMSAPSGADGLARFFTFFLLISNIIPISLYVSMKLARTSQKVFMDNDPQCVYIDQELFERSGGEEGRYPLIVRTMDLNDELGQISHVFSDKTGTLTSNYMEFRKMTVNGILYGRGTTEIGMARRRRLGLDTSELEAIMARNAGTRREVPHVNYIEGSESHPGRVLRGPNSDLHGSGATRDPDQAQALHVFFLNLCLNHTVVLETVKDKHTGQTRSQLSASSPDEEAFVLAAKYFGYEFLHRQKDIAILRIKGVEHKYRVVVVIPYSSARQMMSVVIEDLQCPADQQHRRFMLFAKGSDVRMFKLNMTETPDGTKHTSESRPSSRPSTAASTGPSTPGGHGRSPSETHPPAEDEGAVKAQQTTLIASTKTQLLDMAEDGLRTLAFSYKYIDENVLTTWLDRYEEALGDIQQKRLRDQKLPNKIDDCAKEMESGLLFQGATANEDKLQEQVPETIALLAQAGIKVYMLTGDKQETAINIGYAARMLTNEYARVIISSEELFGDRAQEEGARRRKAQQQADAAAAGMTADEFADQSKWELPAIPTPVLETNARAKLRVYANIARSKAARGVEFSRPRCLVVDEQVLNMIWPSLPQLPPVKPDTLVAAYKDVASAVSRALALMKATGSTDYVDYVDSQWGDAEADVATAADVPTSHAGKKFTDDAAIKAKVAEVLSAAGLPNLFEPGGLAHIEQDIKSALLIQRDVRRASVVITTARDAEALAAGGAAGGLPAAAVAEAVAQSAANRTELEKICATLQPKLQAAYAAVIAVMKVLAPPMQQDLLVLAESCKSVIACRCRPDQKKKMLELVKQNVKTSRCLAIGDGANDVDMIQAANVGVGIVGPEGVQAANASDYAIGRFKFLKRLTLVHGRWNYNRMAKLICYMYYKNVFFSVAQMIYTVVAAWSGQKFYSETASQTYNILYTGIPILLVAVMDQDVSEENALKFPFLYNDGLTRKRLNIGILLWWLVSAVYESIILFVFVVFGTGYSSKNGSSEYVFEMGSWVFSALVVCVNLRLALNTYKHTWLFAVWVFLSVASWWPMGYIIDALNADNLMGSMQYIFGSGAFWLWLLLVSVVSQAPQIALGLYQRLFAPEYRDLVLDYEVLMTPAASSPSGFKALCNCGVSRSTTKTRPTPTALMAILESKGSALTSSSTSASSPNGASSPNRKGAATTPEKGATTIDVNTHASSSTSGALMSPGAHRPLLSSGATTSPTHAAPTGAEAAALAACAAGEPCVPLPAECAELDVDFGPDLTCLPGMHSHKGARCSCSCDSGPIPCAEDGEGALIEWPIEQTMRSSLGIKRRQLYEEALRGQLAEHPEVALRKAKIEMLRARLTVLLEQHGTRGSGIQPSPVEVVEEEAPAGSEQSSIGAASAGAGSATVGGAASAVAISVGPAPASGAADSVAASTITHPATASWNLQQARTGQDKMFVKGLRTVTDYSQDDKSSDFYSGIQSSVGRRVSQRKLQGVIAMTTLRKTHPESATGGSSSAREPQRATTGADGTGLPRIAEDSAAETARIAQAGKKGRI